MGRSVNHSIERTMPTISQRKRSALLRKSSLPMTLVIVVVLKQETNNCDQVERKMLRENKWHGANFNLCKRIGVRPGRPE